MAPFATSPPIQPATAAASGQPSTPPNVEFSIPAHANEMHPVSPAPRAALPPPPTENPVYTIAAPLSFSAGTPLPPADPPIDTVLLVREAQAQPAWEFKGHVDPPTFAAAMQHALGEGATQTQPPAEPRQKRRGFWGFWRRISNDRFKLSIQCRRLSEIYGPKARRGTQELDSYQGLPRFRFSEPRDPAGQIFVCLQVGHE